MDVGLWIALRFISFGVQPRLQRDKEGAVLKVPLGQRVTRVPSECVSALGGGKRCLLRSEPGTSGSAAAAGHGASAGQGRTAQEQGQQHRYSSDNPRAA